MAPGHSPAMLPNGNCLPVEETSGSHLNPSHADRCAAAPHGTTRESPDRGNQRRLQLRHSGFRAAFLRSNVDTRSSSRHSLVLTDASVPRDRAQRQQERASSSPSPTSILQEISNHATARRTPSRPLLNDIFPSSPNGSSFLSGGTFLNDENMDPTPTPPDQAENGPSKAQSSSQEKKGRRFSLRGNKSAKFVRKPRATSRSTNSEANRYIEHLESELVAMNRKLDVLTSPGIAKSNSAKIRGLTRQTKSLQEELTDWEKKFEERVEEQVFQRSRVEASLQAKIQELRDELDAKDTRALDLQRELEILRQKLVASEVMETNLSRRIDVLTGLLAQSPTRSSFSVASPTIRADSVKRSARPASMILPNLKNSFSNGVCIDAQTPTRCSLRPTLDLRNFDTTTSSPEGSGQALNLDPLSPYNADIRKSFLLEADEFSQGCEPLASETSRMTSELSSMQSTASSRPTSIMSNASIWSAWGLPITPEVTMKTDSKPRKMRRFAAGGTALKPLILPSASTTPDESVSPSADRPCRSPVREERAELFIQPKESWAVERNSFIAATPMDEVTDPWKSPHTLTPSEATWRTPQLHDSSDDIFSGQYLATSHFPLGVKNGPTSPTIASSPLIAKDSIIFTTAGSRASTPIQQSKISDQISRASSSGARTLRIRTPSANLDSLMLQETPKSEFISPLRPSGGELPSRQDRSRTSQHCSECHTRAYHRTSLSSSSLLEQCLDRITRLLMTLKRTTLLNIRTVLVRAWIRGSSGFGAFGWWLFGLTRSSQPLHSAGRPSMNSPERQETIEALSRCTVPTVNLQPTTREGVLGAWWSGVFGMNPDQVRQDSIITRPRGTCQECIEPRLQQKLRLWCRFSLTIVLAVGIAILHGPECLMHDTLATDRYEKNKDLFA